MISARRKKNRRIRRAVLFLAAGLLLCSAVAGVVWAGFRVINIKEVRLPGIFRIQTVRVEGISEGRAAEVREVIKKQPDAFSNDFTYQKMQQAVARLPWIKEVQFRKEWPDGLVVKVSERTPFAWVEDRGIASERGRYRLVDEDAVDLDFLGHPAGGFPVIRLGPNRSDPGRGKVTAGILALKAFAAGGIEGGAFGEAEVEVRDPQDVLIRYKGLPLRLGFGDPNEQIRRFLVLQQELLARASEISEVDLRFPGRLIVRSKMEEKNKTYRAAPRMAARPASLERR